MCAPFRLQVAAETVPRTLVAAVELAARAGYTALVAVCRQEGQVIAGRRIARLCILYGHKSRCIGTRRRLNDYGIGVLVVFEAYLPILVRLCGRRDERISTIIRHCVHHAMHIQHLVQVGHSGRDRPGIDRLGAYEQRLAIDGSAVEPVLAGKGLVGRERRCTLRKGLPCRRIRGLDIVGSISCSKAASTPGHDVEGFIGGGGTVFPAQVQAYTAEVVSGVGH